MVGKVLWFDVKKGWGFIRPTDPKDEIADVFVHFSKIQSPEGEFRILEPGEQVEFEVFYADRGDTKKPQAKNVKKQRGYHEQSI